MKACGVNVFHIYVHCMAHILSIYIENTAIQKSVENQYEKILGHNK